MLNRLTGLLSAGSIGIIGGADGPTAIFTTSDPELGHALTLLWQGMSGIFVVMLAIAGIVWLLSRLTSRK